jgi:hypothetical protein
LAIGAVIGAALTDDYPQDGCPTVFTGIPILFIHPKVILVVPSTINPVNAGSIMPDSFLE